MGKRHVRVVRVSKWVTVTLLVLVSGAIAALLWYLSGKAYVGGNTVPDVLSRVVTEGRVPSRDAFFAVLMPILGNVMLFLPWGFLLFLTVDRPERSRIRGYGLTFIAGLFFAMMLYLWQEMLPTRVTTLSDAAANAVGALAGAALGHMRKKVRVRFDF
ncbi:MAG TPA: VanZ family protein [Thermoanaerobaculia bacterium]|jgi:VanZ family protein